MNKIPTAEEMVEKYTTELSDGMKLRDKLGMKQALIDFAKLHLEAYKKAILDASVNFDLDEEILSRVYPIENIK